MRGRSGSPQSATAAKPAGDKVTPADLPAVVANRTHRGDAEGNGKVVETTFVEGNPDNL